jgi:hypothetical protein
MKQLILFLVFIFLYIALFSCKSVISGSRNGVSRSIEESRKNGTYKWSYSIDQPLVNPENDSIIPIDQIFLESVFEVQDNFDIWITDHYQLIIKLKEDSPDSYSLDWKIASPNNEFYFVSGGNYFKSVNLPESKLDTIYCYVKGDRYSDVPDSIFYTFKLVKK